MHDTWPPLMRLADLLLEGEGGLAPYVAARREEGSSWDTVAKRLWLATGQQVDVGGTTVQAWQDRLEAEARQAAS